MSTNLHLVDSKTRAKAEILQTPTDVTWKILKWKSNADRLRAYFQHVDDTWQVGPGQKLDHKLEVLMWIVDHPKYKFEAW